MPTAKVTPADVIGKAAVKRLAVAGFDIVARPALKRVRYKYTCPMCGYSEYGGQKLEAFADWGLIWHRGCVSPYEVTPSKRGKNKPMIRVEEPL